MMRQVIKRVALNGLAAGALLGAVGYVYAEIASMWLLQGGDTRSAVPAAGPPAQELIRKRVPLTMAAWGFTLVTVFELLLTARRRKQPRPAAKDLAAQPQVDPAEALLEELLSQAESAIAEQKGESQGSGVRGQEPGDTNPQAEAADLAPATTLTPGP